MNRKVKDIGVVVEETLCSITMMNIPVDDSHLFHQSLFAISAVNRLTWLQSLSITNNILHQIVRSHAHIVEQAKATSLTIMRMVSLSLS
jgi:hypothetical protein